MISTSVLNVTTGATGNVAINIISNGKRLIAADSAGYIILIMIGYDGTNYYLKVLDYNLDPVCNSEICIRITWFDKPNIVNV